jgi:hypothetical protein
MITFPSHEIPTDEPFKLNLTPLAVATAVQHGLSALWLASPEDRRSPGALEQFALQMFEAVEQWWFKLKERSGVAIVEAIQEAFGPPRSTQIEAMVGPLRMQTRVSWVPSHSFAEALLWAWLLQPDSNPTPQGTAQVVRRILERQICRATEDIAAFARPV